MHQGLLRSPRLERLPPRRRKRAFQNHQCGARLFGDSLGDIDRLRQHLVTGNNMIDAASALEIAAETGFAGEHELVRHGRR